jgi:hypothetical protein
MLIYQDCQNDQGLQLVAGEASNTPIFNYYVNSAVRRLLRRGDWPSVTPTIYVAVYGGCITWPRYVGHVRRLNTCHHHAVPVHNRWWEFLPKTTWCDGYWGGWPNANRKLTNFGQTTVLMNVMGEGRFIQAHARCNQDFGKTLTIFGTDNNGQTLIQSNGTGGFTAGLTLTLGLTDVRTPVFVRHIDYIIKDQTQCPVDVYAFNNATGLLEDIAHYEPGETRPNYDMSKLSGWTCTCSTCITGATPQGVEALVKLRFIPASNPNDLVIIDNLDAIRMEVQSIKAEEAGDHAGKRLAEQEAVMEMNRELENQSPDDQFSVSVQSLGPRVRCNSVF